MAGRVTRARALRALRAEVDRAAEGLLPVPAYEPSLETALWWARWQVARHGYGLVPDWDAVEDWLTMEAHLLAALRRAGGGTGRTG